MRVCLVGKFPPIEGGTSHQTYLTAHELGRRGHEVTVITNAAEVEPEFRALLLRGDAERLEARDGEGSVTCPQSAPVRLGSFVPWTKPYGSELFGRALSVVEEDGCDLLVGWYLEPYGLVAAQVAAATGVPLVLRHAGSDLARLAEHPDLRRAYTWSLRRAELILTTPASVERLLELGAERERLVMLTGSRPPDYYRPDAKLLDLAIVQGSSLEWWEAVGAGDAGLAAPAFEPGRPTIGTYGKVGEEKGSFDLLGTLDAMAGAGRDFNFIAAVGGHRRALHEFVERVGASPALANRTTLIPFLAPWRIPSLLRRCDVTCFLERDFSVATHQPRVPYEVMRMGSCLVCSREVAGKPFYAASLVDGRNCLLVDDPREVAELEGVLVWTLEHPDEVRAIAARGRALMQSLSQAAPSRDAHADAIEAALPGRA